MTATPEGTDNGNGKVTLALLGAKVDQLLIIMSECKTGLDATRERIHQQDIEITSIKKDVAPLVEIQSAFRKQIIAWVFGAVSLSSVVTYAISNLTK